jgi:hypothetical protein
MQMKKQNNGRVILTPVCWGAGGGGAEIASIDNDTEGFSPKRAHSLGRAIYEQL